jgi:hypothetical protein
METIKLPAVLDDYRERKDGSSRITFDSRELTEEEVLILRRFRNEEGWLMFSKNVLDKEDIPEKDAEVDTKTPAQRLRAVLFIRWKNLGEPETFKMYYDKTMESFINAVKDKLD